MQLGSFNPGAVHQRELPHIKFKPNQSFPRVKIVEDKNPNQGQDIFGLSSLNNPKPLSQNHGDTTILKRTLSLSSQPKSRKKHSLSDSSSGLGPGIGLQQGLETLFLSSALQNEVINDEETQKEDQNIKAADFEQKAKTILELRHYSSEAARQHSQLTNDISPVIPSSSFFRPFQQDNLACNSKYQDTELKDKEADMKPSLESFMSEMGLHHPRCIYPRASVKTLPSMSAGALKSEESTEKGDEEVENEICTEDEDNEDNDEDEQQMEPEPQCKYFVVYRWWTHEEGEENAQQEVSAPIISQHDANAHARRGLVCPPDGGYPRNLFSGGAPSITFSIKDGQSAWKATFDRGVISTRVQRVELPSKRRPPIEAVWMPRKAFVVHCAMTRIEYSPHNSTDLQNTQPMESEVTMRPSQIVTTLTRANIAAGEMFFEIRAEELVGEVNGEDIGKGLLLSEISRDVREMNKEEKLFDRTWTNTGMTTRIWVEHCNVKGPRN